MYKKLLLAFVSIIAIQTAKAQTEKGSQMLGASFGFSTSSSDTKAFNTFTNAYDQSVHGKTKSYNIAPSYSYFIADKLDLGVSVGFGGSSQKISDIQNQKSQGFNSSIYLRKYFLYDNKIGIRTGPYLSYESTTQEYSYNPVIKNHNDVYGGGIGLDFIYFPVKRLGLAARLGSANYFHQKSDDNTQGTYNSFNLAFVNSLSLSVNYVFGK
jgi:long-subunit fatty acid transport protein